MGSSFKTILKQIACFFLILTLSGCWNSRELNTISIVMGTGLDKPEDGEGVLITAQVVKPGEIKASEKEGTTGTDSNAYWNLEREGMSTFATVRGFTHQASRRLFFPHNQVLILGEDFAEENVRKKIDIFVRDPENRLTVWVLVSKGKAKDIFYVKPELEKITALSISNMVDAYAATSQSISVNLKDFLTRIMSDSTAPVAPFIKIAEKGGKEVLVMEGTAVFKKDGLAGELDSKETRGLMWVLGRVKSGIIESHFSEGGEYVAFEIVRASSKISPEIKNGKPCVKITINEEGNVGEENFRDGLDLASMVKELEGKKSEVIKGEVMAALKKAKELNADIFGFGEKIHKSYPKQWAKLKDNWDTVFNDLEVEVLVNAKLLLTGEIKTIEQGK
ncbi:spore germination protein KC [Anaerobacterium chartisolvens]|uniref:Spore germination protein KC n=1 Tax=Anaerobacterium chartisolvens TaxID=1297424 RepID=A0A369BHE4_9FIRM|nr:Ger(x)C family spore germination protein [Anaerobacterium chartisolvens]RCX20973.1 spore germination protein KC [Anaerobacterium chartisolvens]